MGFDFISEFNRKVTEDELDWDIYGMVDRNENVYSLTDDAKIIGRIFELLAAPGIRGVAEDHNMEVTPAESQTIYPDFTIEKTSKETDGLSKGDEIQSLDGQSISTREDVESVIQDASPDEVLQCEVDRNGNTVSITVTAGQLNKIAVDVKTTYREFYSSNYREYEPGDTKPFVLTLGSYASFLRNMTKNIQYDYRTYSKHYIIGFLYTRNTEAEEGVVKDYEDRREIQPPYENVEYFVQEKYKIAGTSPGSGNTENIGSFKTNDINELQQGNGPFADLGKDVFEEYWRNYGRYREEDVFTNLEEFFEWRDENQEESNNSESRSRF